MSFHIFFSSIYINAKFGYQDVAAELEKIIKQKN